MRRGRPSKFKSECGRQSGAPKDETVADTLVTSEIVESLRLCAQELEEKQDRCERIIKVGRDMTIDSKRLIFYLHTFQKGGPDGDAVLVEAKERLIKIVKSHFKNVINELQNLDIHQFTRAFSYGVQEFIEAFSFYHYLVHDTLLTFKDVEEFLAQNLLAEDGEERTTTTTPESRILLPYQSYFVTMIDYVLGLSDLTGELMRYCINQVAAGRNTIAFDTCQFLTNLYTGMLSVDCHSRDFNRKMYTFVQNVKKVEMACYTVKVRGTEMPKHMIFNVLDNDDEPHDMSF